MEIARTSPLDPSRCKACLALHAGRAWPCGPCGGPCAGSRGAGARVAAGGGVAPTTAKEVAISHARTRSMEGGSLRPRAATNGAVRDDRNLKNSTRIFMAGRYMYMYRPGMEF